MRLCREVAPRVWLGVVGAVSSRACIRPSDRLGLDRQAADQAVGVTAAVSGLCPATCAASRSHTHGVGAVILAPAGMLVGVDLVMLGRVSGRHARAILSDDEWYRLAPYVDVRPGLAWALKEAAAKAGGEPSRCFPDGLAIQRRGGKLIVCQTATGEDLEAGWGRLGSLLYAWVLRPPASQRGVRARASSSTRFTNPSRSLAIG